MALIARTCGGTEYKTTCITHPEEGQHTLWGVAGMRAPRRKSIFVNLKILSRS